MFVRSVRLPPPGHQTFFLWGPRQTGKSTLLRAAYPDAIWIDLLKADEFRRHVQRPEVLRERLTAIAGIEALQVVIDEIQKVPTLLDEVHWLIENRGIHFALCGSSARKVRHGAANLLGGRAVRHELFGLTAGEIGAGFDLDRALNHGALPRIYASDRPRPLLHSYVADYLKEEVAAEGLVRKLPEFATFLDIAALSNGEIVNFTNIARECGVSTHTAQAYFGIVVDTLIGRWLPSYTKRPKRRVIGAPKFYFFDVGIVNHLARRGWLERGGELYGKALEHWVFHELTARDAYGERFARLAYWRLASGVEVDFVIDDMRVAIEVKSSGRVTDAHLSGLRHLIRDHPKVGRRVLVCLEPSPRRTADRIDILPLAAFLDELGDGRVF